MKIINNVVVNVDINVDILRNQTKLFNINNVCYVYCKHKYAINVMVVYVVTYMICRDIFLHDICMT